MTRLLTALCAFAFAATAYAQGTAPAIAAKKGAHKSTKKVKSATPKATANPAATTDKPAK